MPPTVDDFLLSRKTLDGVDSLVYNLGRFFDHGLSTSPRLTRMKLVDIPSTVALDSHARGDGKVVDVNRQTAPEPWATAMMEQGMSNRGLPSMNQLAKRSGVVVETVRQMIFGGRVPEVETVQAVANALRVDVRTVSKWVSQARSVREPWTPPAEAHLLTRKERDALDRLIRVMAERQGESDGTSAPIVRPLRSVARAEKRETGRGKRRND